MAKYCGKCGSRLDENGHCINNCANNTGFSMNLSANNKKKKIIISVLTATFVLMIASVIIIIASSIQRAGIVGNNQQNMSEMMSDGKLDSKEFKSLIKQGTFDISASREEFVPMLCDIVAKFGKPAEENKISKEEAKKVIDDIENNYAGAGYDMIDSYETLYFYKYNEMYIFVDYRYYGINYFTILGVTDNSLYFITDGEKGFRYSAFYDETNSSRDCCICEETFVDKSTKRVVCGFELISFAGNDDIRVVFGHDGNAKIYAYESAHYFYDASLNEVTQDTLSSVMDKYSDLVTNEYDFNFGNWGY